VIYVYVNYGAKGTIKKSIRDLILDEIDNQLLDKYQIDIRQLSFIKGTYASEIARFKRGVFSDLFTSDPGKANEKLSDELSRLIADKEQHIQRALRHIQDARHHQVIIMLDNADQRSDEIQQEAFLVAQELAKAWHCYVFISLRPHTFFRSRQSGVLAAYPHRVFTIAPPRIDDLLDKRLTYALDMAEGRIPIERLSGIELNIKSVALVLRALLMSLKDDELQELLTNLTGGNVRTLLQFVSTFIGSPNVDADKIVGIMESSGTYWIPLHELSKPALLGDYAHYHAETSLALNVFDVWRPDPREHFLVPLLLAYLDFDGSHRGKDGFTKRDTIVDEMQRHGFNQEQIDDAIRRALSKRLIETPERLIAEATESPLFRNLADALRITSVGAYHLKRWIFTFAYLDAMAFDTPIFDDSTADELAENVESFHIRDRLKRTLAFRRYLQAQWAECDLSVPYFNLNELFTRGDDTFASVKGSAYATQSRPA
jgi:hypothetical protein